MTQQNWQSTANPRFVKQDFCDTLVGRLRAEHVSSVGIATHVGHRGLATCNKNQAG